MKNIFLEKSWTKCGGETILRPFSKKIKTEHNSGSTVESFIQFNLIVSCKPLAFTSYKTFSKK